MTSTGGIISSDFREWGRGSSVFLDSLLPGESPYDALGSGQAFCARPSPAEDLTTLADVGDQYGGRLLALEADHKVIFAVSPHDRAGTLVIRSDFPPQSGERPFYVFLALSRTRHEILLPSARHKANKTDADQPRKGGSCRREGEWLTPRLQIQLGPLQLLNQVLLL